MILPPKFSAFVLNPLLLLIATYSLVNATMQKSELLSKYWQSVTTTICKGLQDNIKLSVTIVSEDNDKAWFSPTLPPSSPHVLEGPDDRKMVIVFANYAVTRTSKKSAARPKTYRMSTGTTSLRNHLMKDHMHLWVAIYDKLRVSIKGKAGRAAQKFQHENGLGHHDASMVDPEPLSVPKYSYNAFVDTIVEWIIADDQMQEYSYLNLVNFMAVTAHWVEAVGTNMDGLMMLRLRSNLISYHQIPGHHNGWKLQLSWVMMDNAANNGTFMTHLEHVLLCRRFIFVATEQRIRYIHYLSLHDGFNMSLDIKILQPLLDINSNLSLRDIEKFLDKQDFIELRQYQLSDDEWQALYIIHQILAVCSYFLKSVLILHAFQQRCTEVIPAYMLATILNPNMKLHWFTHYMPEEAEDTRQLFIRTLHDYRHSTAVPPTPMRLANSIWSTWADDLLGNNLFDMTLHPQGLEAELTMDIPPIQGTSVPLPELMEALQMLKFFLKQGQFLNFTTGMSKEDEVAVLEAMLTAEDSIPKDVEAY
ncbi:hypothetical protein ARMGADRAFT_1034021 [Armillaria gallica]|uniref:Uncharacterized protein n=1 Tax=Armillaria gallica TaxID=47427 RepID=A0A2H3CZ65_ARMGA|nr:hypothetical protein ARMGADRAFT_1034021 [Armillaria gallica]